MSSKINGVWQKLEDTVIFGCAGVLVTSLGALMLSQGCSNYQAAASFKNEALSTIGAIANTTVQSRGAASSEGSSLPPAYISVVRFKTEQAKIVEFKAVDICLCECNGKEVKVLYASDNPRLAMVEGGSSPLDEVRKTIGWGISLILSGLWLLTVAFKQYGKQFGSKGLSNDESFDKK